MSCGSCQTNPVSSKASVHRPGRAHVRALGSAMWTAGEAAWASPASSSTCPHQGENLILPFVNLRKPDKQSLLEIRPGFAMDIWKILPCFLIFSDCPRGCGTAAPG